MSLQGYAQHLFAEDGICKLKGRMRAKIKGLIETTRVSLLLGESIG